MLRASTRTPTARIRRATALSTSLTFRAVTLPLRTSARRPLGLDTALTSSRLLPPRQGHECSGRRCHGRHHPSCQRAPTAFLGLHNTGIPRRDSRPCGHRRRRRSSHAPLGLQHVVTAGGIPRDRVRVIPSGGVRRRRGPDSCPPTRSSSPVGKNAPPRAGCPPPEGNAPGRRKDAMWTVRNGAARDSRVVRLTRAGQRRRRAERRSR